MTRDALILLLVASGIVPCFILALPPFRKPLVACVLEILLALRWLFVGLPLRAITGRRKPDYARIAELERELGWREDPERLYRHPEPSTPAMAAPHLLRHVPRAWCSRCGSGDSACSGGGGR